jgi:hypothetical protein
MTREQKIIRAKAAGLNGARTSRSASNTTRPSAHRQRHLFAREVDKGDIDAHDNVTRVLG